MTQSNLEMWVRERCQRKCEVLTFLLVTPFAPGFPLAQKNQPPETAHVTIYYLAIKEGKWLGKVIIH